MLQFKSNFALANPFNVAGQDWHFRWCRNAVTEALNPFLVETIAPLVKTLNFYHISLLRGKAENFRQYEDKQFSWGYQCGMLLYNELY